MSKCHSVCGQIETGEETKQIPRMQKKWGAAAKLPPPNSCSTESRSEGALGEELAASAHCKQPSAGSPHPCFQVLNHFLNASSTLIDLHHLLPHCHLLNPNWKAITALIYPYKIQFSESTTWSVVNVSFITTAAWWLEESLCFIGYPFSLTPAVLPIKYFNSAYKNCPAPRHLHHFLAPLQKKL